MMEKREGYIKRMNDGRKRRVYFLKESMIGKREGSIS